MRRNTAITGGSVAAVVVGTGVLLAGTAMHGGESLQAAGGGVTLLGVLALATFVSRLETLREA